MKRFWMCFVEGKSSPNHRHNTKEEAMIEAERLARTMGAPAYVLEATDVATVDTPPIVWERLAEAL